MNIKDLFVSDVTRDIAPVVYFHEQSAAKLEAEVGEYIIKIGRKILDVVCHAFSEFPMATFGTVFGGIVGTLISSIPILGLVLAPIVTPILMALGLIGGLVLDFQDKMLERKIARKVAEFSPLTGE